MADKFLIRSLRIICILIMGTSISVFLAIPCSADNSQSMLSDFGSVEPENPEIIDRSASPSDFADLRPGPSETTPTIDPTDPTIERVRQQGVNWEGVLRQSTFFLAIQQGFRLGFQSGTRNALKGRFFRDWAESVKSTKGWGDGDDFMTNYIGHPMEGSIAANIFVQNDPKAREQIFGWDYWYWNSRLKAAAWSALYSTQFELGPISEASLGNVGYHGKSFSGFVDLVITPLAGLGWQVGEDALDKYLIVRIETWTMNPMIRTLARGFLNPTRAFANIIHMKAPWARDTRPGIWRNR